MLTEVIVAVGVAVLTAGYWALGRRKKADLKDKVVVVTGASSGIGEAAAMEFYERGCRVVLAARSLDKLEQLKKNLSKHHKADKERIGVVHLDLEDPAGISRAAAEILNVFGGVDILLSNAGLGCRDAVVHIAMTTYRKIMDVNFFGQVALIKELLPSIIERGPGGSVIVVSSLQGRFAIPRGSAYGATKHALQAFCDSLRAEIHRQGTNVLVVSPGYVRTNHSTYTMHGDGTFHSEERSEIAHGMSANHVAQRIADATQAGCKELVLAPVHHRLVIAVRALVPSLYFYIMNKRA